MRCAGSWRSSVLITILERLASSYVIENLQVKAGEFQEVATTAPNDKVQGLHSFVLISGFQLW